MRTAMRAGALVALAITSLSSSLNAQAGPADELLTPIVEEGEREFDFKAGSAKSREGTRERQFAAGLGWGVNSRWFTELYAVWHQAAGEPRRLDAWEWENRFQLTETGRYSVDVGLLFEIERAKDRSEGVEYRWGPLLQSDLTPSVQANLNLLIEKRIRAATPSKAELGYQWQLKYRWQPALEFGLQGFGDVGPWNDWEPGSEQPHVAGPALFGRVNLGPHQVVKYNAGLLFGLTHGAPRKGLRLQAEYEF